MNYKMKEWALFYAKLGLAVFPIKPISPKTVWEITGYVWKGKGGS